MGCRTRGGSARGGSARRSSARRGIIRLAFGRTGGLLHLGIGRTRGLVELLRGLIGLLRDVLPALGVGYTGAVPGSWRRYLGAECGQLEINGVLAALTYKSELSAVAAESMMASSCVSRRGCSAVKLG